ncbi:MAG: lipopolysaccharide biosynthesis protein [Burkholderiaceae bacterium]
MPKQGDEPLVAGEAPLTEHDDNGANLGKRSISAVLWGALGAFVRTGMQIGAQVVLARILGPETYGLFALGMVVVLFSNFFADAGLAYGLIQRKSVSDSDIRFIFTWQMLLGAAVTLALIAISPWVGSFFDDVRLSDVVVWLSLTCLINSFGATAQCLLRRKLDFKTVNVAAIVSYAIGFLGLGIPMAMMGYEVYALVVASLTQTGLAAIWCFLKCRHPIRPLLWQDSSVDIIKFGATAFSTSLLNWLMSNLDRMVIGRALNLTAAGLYSTVSNFITSPSVQLLALLQSVLYSASSRVQDSPRRLRKGFRTMFGVVALCMGPVFFSIAVIAPTVIEAIYGAKWMGGEVVLAPLAVAIPAYLLMGMAVPVLWASGNVTKEFKLQIPIAVVWVLVLIGISSTGSLAAVSWAVCALYYARSAVIIAATLKAVRVRAREIPVLLRAGVATTVLVASVAWLTDQALADSLSALPRLFAVMIACAIALPISVRLVRHWVRREVVMVITKLAERVPGGLGRRAAARLFGQPLAVQ